MTTVVSAEIEAKRKRVEDWFNGSMDRVSGWYKRRTHVVMIIIGLLMAVVLNVDSIYIIKHLNSDKTAREALVAAAADLVKSPPSQTDPPAKTDRRQHRPSRQLWAADRMGPDL